jgi:hypothetical protein
VSDTNTLTVPDVLPLLRQFASVPGNECGGTLHIVLDDGNIDDDSVRWVVKYAREQQDPLGVQLAETLLRLSMTQRETIYRAWGQIPFAERGA